MADARRDRVFSTGGFAVSPETGSLAISPETGALAISPETGALAISPETGAAARLDWDSGASADMGAAANCASGLDPRVSPIISFATAERAAGNWSPTADPAPAGSDAALKPGVTGDKGWRASSAAPLGAGCGNGAGANCVGVSLGAGTTAATPTKLSSRKSGSVARGAGGARDRSGRVLRWVAAVSSPFAGACAIDDETPAAGGAATASDAGSSIDMSVGSISRAGRTMAGRMASMRAADRSRPPGDSAAAALAFAGVAGTASRGAGASESAALVCSAGAIGRAAVANAGVDANAGVEIGAETDSWAVAATGNRAAASSGCCAAMGMRAGAGGAAGLRTGAPAAATFATKLTASPAGRAKAPAA
jgi:hypothetical protein